MRSGVIKNLLPQRFGRHPLLPPFPRGFYFMNGYELSRSWFDWCHETKEKYSTNHAALYFYIIELCNRLNWKVSFGLPTQNTMDVLALKKHKTYYQTLQDLADWGFIEILEKAKNQHQSTRICLGQKGKSTVKAREKHGKSRAYIDKPLKTNKNNIPTLEDVVLYFTEKGYKKEAAETAYNYYSSNDWKDSRGKQVLNWKQKMIAVWFKEENKIQKRTLKLIQ